MSAPETTPAAPIPAPVPAGQTNAAPEPTHDEPAKPEETAPPTTGASAPTDEPAPVAEPKESKELEKPEAKENRRSGFFSKLISTTFKRSSRKETRDQRSSSEETPKETEVVKAAEPKEAEAPVPAPVPVEAETATKPADTGAAAPPPATSEGEAAPKPEDQAEKEEAKDKLLPEPSKAVDDVKTKATKVGRRLSARMNLFFKPKSKEEVPQQKVSEEPPKIEESAPVAPLDNLSPQPEAPNAAEEPKPEATPAAPAVAAAA